MGINFNNLPTVIPQQPLNIPKVNTLFQQVRGKLCSDTDFALAFYGDNEIGKTVCLALIEKSPALIGFGLVLIGFGLVLIGFGLVLIGFGLALIGFGLALIEKSPPILKNLRHPL